MTPQQYKMRNQRHLSHSTNNRELGRTKDSNSLLNNLQIKNFPIQVQTGLGDRIDQQVALSPTLTRQIQELKKRNWKFQWNTPTEGSKCQFNEDGTFGILFIDGSLNPGADIDINAEFTLRYALSTRTCRKFRE